MNSFLLIGMIFFAFLGVIISAPSINIPAFTGFRVGNNYLFPILFVTVACGAISGFHSLVASGTVSKQINNEKYMLPIGFGSMLVECLLAVIALICVAAITVNGMLPEGVVTPPQVFAYAVAGFLSYIRLPPNLIVAFITLCISSFALTSLDTVARIGRLSFQEFFSDAKNEGREPSPAIKFITNKYVATLITLALSYALAIVGYAAIWPLFGSANQLLGALALVACSAFLKKTKRKGFMLWAPMFAMFAVTLSALGITVRNKLALIFDGSFNVGQDLLQLLFGLLLLALGIMVAAQGIMKLRGKDDSEEQTA
jgi:carbon starvation protein